MFAKVNDMPFSSPNDSSQLSCAEIEISGKKAVVATPEILTSYGVPSSSKIAIVGISGRFPESASVSEFMDNLYSSRDLITSDDRRWPAGIYGIPERHGQLKNITDIDAAFFRIHGAQAEKMDPQLRLLLSCTYEALNDAGLNPSEMRGSRTGVYVGACFSDLHDYTLRDPAKIVGYENTGCAHSMFANRLSFAFDWNGPSFVVDTACSSSMVAFSQACTALERGDCDVAVVGGVSVTLRPEVNLAFKKLGMLSPDGSCKSFDTRANGYCRSECVGVAILTRVDGNSSTRIAASPHPALSALPNRQNEGFPRMAGAASLEGMLVRHSYAFVRGHGVNNDGLTHKGITFPSVEAQTSLNAQTLARSGLTAKDIGYIEAHGTGTTAGDGVELKALDDVYGVPGFVQGRETCLLGSVKSNMGHAEGAAGIASLIKVMASFERNVLPPNIHYQEGNSSTTDALKVGRFVVPTQSVDISHVKAAAISSFGFGGTNAHVIIERNPIQVVNRNAMAISFDVNSTAPIHFSTKMNEGHDSSSHSTTDLPSVDGQRNASADESLLVCEDTNAVAEGASNKHVVTSVSLSVDSAESNDENGNELPNLPSWLIDRLPALIYTRTFEGAQKMADIVKSIDISEVRRGLPSNLPAVLGAVPMDATPEWLQTVTPVRASISSNGIVEASAVDRNAFTSEEFTAVSGRPIWIAFTGNGGMWPGMGTDLYHVSPLFRETMDEAIKIGCEYNSDLKPILFAVPEDAVKVVTNCTTAEAMMAQVALQIGLVRMIQKELKLRVSGFLGHSAGEIAAAYFDGCITFRQALEVAFHRNDVIDSANLKPGHMYAAGITREVADALIAQANMQGKVVVGCHNDPSGVTLSGEASYVDQLAAGLVEKKIFCRKVETKGVAHHSPMLQPLYDTLIERLDKCIPKPVKRSKKWISTCCVPERSARDREISEAAASHYFGWNFIQAVEWVNGLQDVPKGAVIIEVGPHALLASPTKRTRPDLLYISSMKKGELGSDTFANMYAALWRSGALDHSLVLAKDSTTHFVAPPSLRITHPDLRSALVQWDFSTVFPIMFFADAQAQSSQGTTVTLHVGKEDHDDHALLDHVIDGKPLIPAAAYVRACWSALADASSFTSPDLCPVELVDFHIHQATQVDAVATPEKVTFKATVAPGKDGYKLVSLSNEEGELIASCKGKILCAPASKPTEAEINHANKVLSAQAKAVAQLVDEVSSMSVIKSSVVDFVDVQDAADASHPDSLTQNAFYTNIRSRGYEYGPHFRPVLRIDGSTYGAQAALMEFDQITKWVSLVDGLLQVLISPKPDCRGPETSGTLAVPTKIEKIVLRPDLLDLDKEKRTVAAIEPWNRSACCKWAAVEGLEMKPLKRADKERLPINLTTEVKAPLVGDLPLSASALKSIEQHGVFETGCEPLLDAAFELIEHTTGAYDSAVVEMFGGMIGATKGVSSFLSSRTSIRAVVGLIVGSAPSHLDVEGSFRSNGVSSVVTVGDMEGLKKEKPTCDVLFVRDASNVGLVKQVALTLSAKFVVTYTSSAYVRDSLQITGDVCQIDGDVLASFSTSVASVTVVRLTPVEIKNPAILRTSRCDLESADAFNTWKSQLTTVSETHDRVFLVGSEESGVLGFYRCLRKEGKDSVRLVLLPSESDVEIVVNQGVSHPVMTAAVRKDIGILVVDVSANSLATFVHSTLSLENVVLENSKSATEFGAYITFSRAGDLSSATWTPSDRAPDSDEVVVDVFASALNFKDVMLAYGKIDSSAFYGRVPPRSVGFELAGVERASGRRVMGFSDDALATVAYSRSELLWEVPEKWTLNEAATVPVVYATAYYALFVRGGLASRPKNSSVLIHAAAGGVGQAATRIALNRGLEVFVTCSSSKIDFLKNLFPTLKPENIFDSRSTSFERGVMRATHGRGVDLVLNSLSDEKLQASTRVVAQHGAFLEIGKYDIMEHSAVDLHLLVKNIAIHGIDVDQVRFDKTQWDMTHALVSEGLRSGEVQPLGFKSFGASEVTDMFRFMAEGQHIGKVILDLSDEEQRKTVHSSSVVEGRPRVFLQTSDAQIIIGGLGGFGLALAWFLAERGSRFIYLTGRSGIVRGEQTLAITALKERFPGITVEVVKCDVAKQSDCEKMIADITSKNNVRIHGVYNLAMVLADGLFDSSMDGKRWMSASAPKVQGTDAMLSALNNTGKSSDVHYFVTFSSVAAGLGNAGQSNYAYGNSHMDALARKNPASDELKFISVQWGTIGDVGVAARQLEGGFLEDVLCPQPLASCLSTLERLLLENKSGVFQSYLPANRASDDGAASLSAIDGVLAILRLPREGLRPNATLESLGMDSMQAVEVQSALRRATGQSIPVAKIQQITVAELEVM
eukprot:GDKJ01062516.1.p1 GENE.GDKJ01062516.1~~GDKJ01062516.1.p1  ORF type:complete len:2370 (+),score=702.37 GDKJ01062516.1:32-7141(+)